jgi:hypothetical protein
VIAARLDAFQQVQQVGLEVRFVVCRRDAVDAGRAILAGEPVGLQHPVHVDDVVERVERRAPFRSRQFGYPLSFRGQVCEVQGPLLFHSNGSLLVTPPFPLPGPGEPGSPMSAVL